MSYETFRRRLAPLAPTPGVVPLMSVLVSRADEAAFADYVRRHRRSALALAARLVPEREAEDVVQEAVTRVWRRWPTVEHLEAEHQRNLIHKIVRDVALNTRRHHRVRPVDLTADWEPVALPASPCVSEAVLFAELREEVADALDAMPERHRVVVQAHLAVSASTDELARQMGVAPGTVRVHRQRGLKVLRERLTQFSAPFVLVFGKVARRVDAAAVTPAGQAALATLVAASVAWHPGANGSRTVLVPAAPRAARPSVPVALEEASLPEPAARGRAKPASAPASRVGTQPADTQQQPPSPRKLPTDTSPAGRLCVTADKCVGREPYAGDEVCVTDGQDRRMVCQKQSGVPVCDHAPRAPVVTSERDGEPTWTVEPPVPATP